MQSLLTEAGIWEALWAQDDLPLAKVKRVAYLLGRSQDVAGKYLALWRYSARRVAFSHGRYSYHKRVGPRDGLQSQPVHLTVEARLELVTALIDARLPEIEVGSFVSPKAVPQMAGTERWLQPYPRVAAHTVSWYPIRKGMSLPLRGHHRDGLGGLCDRTNEPK